jgi:hypothetical protein
MYTNKYTKIVLICIDLIKENQLTLFTGNKIYRIFYLKQFTYVSHSKKLQQNLNVQHDYEPVSGHQNLFHLIYLNDILSLLSHQSGYFPRGFCILHHISNPL